MEERRKAMRLQNELGISVEEYENWKAEAEFTNLISLDDYLEQGNEGGVWRRWEQNFSSPIMRSKKQELKEMLVEALKKTDRKRAECHHIILLRRIDIKRD